MIVEIFHAVDTAADVAVALRFPQPLVAMLIPLVPFVTRRGLGDDELAVAVLKTRADDHALALLENLDARR